MQPRSAIPSRNAWKLILLCASSVLVPLMWCWPQFRLLFFFHDDWELLDGAARMSLGRWLAEPFLGEGIFPLFKLLWLGAVHVFGGSYFGLILLLWLTHVVIVVLFGWLLARFEIPPFAIAFALLTFGLAWTNLETLGWSMQWCSQLAILFFLIAWHAMMSARRFAVRAIICFLCLLASALCSSRGIISGAVLAVFVLVEGKRPDRARWLAVTLAPAVLLSGAMWLWVPHHAVSPLASIAYAAVSLMLNPLFRPLPIPRHGFEIAAWMICGAIKVGVFVWAIRTSAYSARPLLWTLAALDGIVSASLGYSRWQTGLATVTSSRYQYIPLLCFGPAAGLVLARLGRRTRVAVLVLCGLGLLVPWKQHAEQWALWRGVELRAAIQKAAPNQRFDPSSIPAGRARELIARYGLN